MRTSIVRYVGIIIGSLDILIGGIGNGLTIVAFITNKRLWNTFNIFIVNLSKILLIIFIILITHIIEGNF